MTIRGALSDLDNLLKADDIPFYYKPSIKAVMDTIVLSSSEKPNNSTTKNDLGVDCISRQAVLDLIADYDLSMGQVVKGIHALPSVTPIRPKGHWIRVTDKTGHLVWECDKCGWQQRFNTNYCPDCGANMREVVEE